MLSRDGLSVALIRASDEQEFPKFTVTDFARNDRLNSTAITVQEGDIFFPRITIESQFAWYDANVLELMINYNKAHRWGCEGYFMLPRVVKPETAETIIVNLVKCPVNEKGLTNLQEFSTKFEFEKWSEPEYFEHLYREPGMCETLQDRRDEEWIEFNQAKPGPETGNTLDSGINAQGNDEVEAVKEDPDSQASNLVKTATPEDADIRNDNDDRSDSDIQTSIMAKSTAPGDSNIQDDNNAAIKTTAMESNRRRTSVYRLKGSRLPDETMYDLRQDTNGEWFNGWAHIAITVRRLWDPSLAKPDDQLPYKSFIDDRTCVTEDSNNPQYALNVEFLNPQKSEIILPTQPAHRLWRQPKKESMSILVDNTLRRRFTTKTYNKIHFIFHCKIEEIMKVEPIDLTTDDRSRSSSVEFIKEVAKPQSSSSGKGGVKHERSDDGDEDEDDGDMEAIVREIKLQRLLVKKDRMQARKRARTGVKEEIEEKVKLEEKKFVII